MNNRVDKTYLNIPIKAKSFFKAIPLCDLHVLHMSDSWMFSPSPPEYVINRSMDILFLPEMGWAAAIPIREYKNKSK